MPSFNKVILMGNLTREPDVRHIPNGTAVAEFGIAMNRKFKVGEEQREEVTFVDCTAWGRTAEIIGTYLTKGSLVHVEGRLQLDQWDDKETGQKRSKLKVVVENLTMCGTRNGGRDDAGNDPPADGDVPF